MPSAWNPADNQQPSVGMTQHLLCPLRAEPREGAGLWLPVHSAALPFPHMTNLCYYSAPSLWDLGQVIAPLWLLGEWREVMTELGNQGTV